MLPSHDCGLLIILRVPRPFRIRPPEVLPRDLQPCSGRRRCRRRLGVLRLGRGHVGGGRGVGVDVVAVVLAAVLHVHRRHSDVALDGANSGKKYFLSDQ